MKPHNRRIIRDKDDLCASKQVMEELSKHAEQYRAMIATNLFGFWIADTAGKLLDVNDTYCRMSGYTREELLQRSIPDLEAVESTEDTVRHIQLLIEAGVAQFESRHRARDGRIFDVEVSTSYLFSQGNIIAFFRDISERKQREILDLISREVLLLLERSKNTGETICNILEKAKMILGLDAVAIRLRDGDDIPYYATNGFPDEFVHAERFLCAYNEAGKMVRDENGKPVLECICGKVLSGWSDPELPFLSESGSFWSNNTSGLLVSTIETECLGRIRGRCIREGYESLALIPLRAGEEIIGLLQFNDRRPNQFTAEMIRTFERLGTSIGMALSQKQAEDALRESEARYHAVIEDQTDLICRYRPDGRLSFANEAYLRYFGKKRKQLLNRNFIPHIPEPDLSMTLEQLKGITPAKPIANVEHRVIMPDGTVRWQHWIHRGIYTPDGVIIEYQAVGRDFTDRKRAEDGLLEKNRFLDALLDAIPIPIFFKDSDARYIGFNKAYEEFYGKPREELIGKSVFDIAPRELAEVYHARDGELLLQKETQIYESQVLDALGDEHVVVFHKAALVGPGGEVNGLIGAILDVTERKRAEEALRASREKFKAYVDNSFDVIFVLNAEGVFQFISQAWERHFGYHIKVALGKNFASFVHPDDITPCAEYLTYVLSGGEARTSPAYRVKHADGSWRWFVANGSRYLNTINEWQYIGVGHDITETLRAETELMHALVAADSASRAKSDFLATMSHEIRTPLSALLGNIELLASSPLSPQQQEALKDCQTASQMLLQTINDVLDFSKIEAGKLELLNETFSVSSMVMAVVRIFAGNAELKGITISLTLADDLPVYISGDQHRLRQIISNLLSNAIKFTRHGTIFVEICKEQPSSGSTPDKTVLGISVRDSGIGIPSDKQASIFDSFSQVENFSTRRHAGTGLGLAICRRLAEMMGGTISVSSTLGVGSVFTLSLPVTVCQPPQPVKRKRSDAPTAIPRNILLADDEQLGRTVTATLLQRRGHRVTAVENGAALLEVLKRQKFDIVLSDISMPDMDGMEIARIIRSGRHAGIDPQIPIIAMTAHAFVQDRARFLESGINDYAAKPVNFEKLLCQIDDLCGDAAG